MILYKYVPFEIGRRIVSGNSLLFSQPATFNDPFDIPSYPNEPVVDLGSAIFGRIRTMGKNWLWAERSGILSLTRTPSNALMWAHYADSHRGMVLGIDANAAGLFDERSNLVPAQFGSVVYVSRRVTGPFVGKPTTAIAVGATHHFPPDHYEKLQRVFLHKPLGWAYEEEVRVVKCLHGLEGDGGTTPSGTFSIVRTSERPLHLFQLREGAIREVHFGIRADHGAASEAAAELRHLDPTIRVLEAVLDDRELSVRAQPFVRPG